VSSRASALRGLPCPWRSVNSFFTRYAVKVAAFFAVVFGRRTTAMCRAARPELARRVPSPPSRRRLGAGPCALKKTPWGRQLLIAEWTSPVRTSGI